MHDPSAVFEKHQTLIWPLMTGIQWSRFLFGHQAYEMLLQFARQTACLLHLARAEQLLPDLLEIGV